jgi:TadE-like protein
MKRSSPRRSLLALRPVPLSHHRKPDETGASLVEFAIILPVFAVMLFGMIQFGLTFAGWDQLRNAVQTGARLAANNAVTTPGTNCAQVDPGSNMICQISLLIGAPVGTSPTPVAGLAIPAPYTCTLTASAPSSGASLQACTASQGGDGYAWLDGYYVFDDGQWLQIVASSSPSSGQIPDSEAFQYGAQTWTCTGTQGANCTGLSTTDASGTPELGSDNIAIAIQADELEVCAQRRVISFTALPGLQDVHLSTSSTFYIPAPSPLCGSSQACTYPSGSACG